MAQYFKDMGLGKILINLCSCADFRPLGRPVKGVFSIVFSEAWDH